MAKTHKKKLEEGLEQLSDLLSGNDADVRWEVVEVEGTDVALLRRALGMSQREFAERIGVSVDTIQNWEQGRRKPRGPARALLNMLARNPVLLADDPRNDFALADPHDSDDHREHAHPQAAKLTQREGNDTCTLEGTRHADTAAKNCPSGVDIGEAQDAPEIDRPIIQEASLGGANFYETILRQATLKRATLPPANLKTVTTHIGQRVRQLRWMRELTQHQLAQRIGVKLQQLQSYETGSKRISAGRLWAIATVLEVPISSFFEGLAEPAADTTKSRDNVRTATKAG